MTRINWRDHAPHVSKRNVLVGNLLGPAGGSAATIGAHVLGQLQLVARHMMQPGRTGDYHVHADQEQIYYFLRGAGKMHVDEEIHPVRAGELICLPATCYHQLINDGDDWIEHLLIAGARLPERQRAANAAAIAANGPAGSKLPIACRSWLDVSPFRSATGALFIWRAFARRGRTRRSPTLPWTPCRRSPCSDCTPATRPRRGAIRRASGSTTSPAAPASSVPASRASRCARAMPSICRPGPSTASATRTTTGWSI